MRIRINTQRVRYASGHLYELRNVTFSTLVQYKGGLSEIVFTVPLFSNASMVFLPFLQILCNLYKGGGGGGELSIFVRGHRKVTGIRYIVEMLFIILERYAK